MLDSGCIRLILSFGNTGSSDEISAFIYFSSVCDCSLLSVSSSFKKSSKLDLSIPDNSTRFKDSSLALGDVLSVDVSCCGCGCESVQDR